MNEQDADEEMSYEPTTPSSGVEEYTNTSDSVQRWNTCKFGDNYGLRFSKSKFGIGENRISLLSGSRISCGNSERSLFMDIQNNDFLTYNSDT